MKKLLYLIILLIPLTLLAEEKKDKKAKKEEPVKVSALLKTARTAIKNGRDQKKAEENLVAAITREDVTNEDRADIYYTCAQLEHSLNDGQNLKAYLKQQYDTATFFSTIQKMYEFTLKCDSVESVPVKGKVKYRYRGKNRSLMEDTKYRRNLYQGGAWFYRKQQWKNAWDHFHMYRQTVDHPLLALGNKYKQDTLTLRSAYLATAAAFNADMPKETLIHIDEAISSQDSAKQVALEEIKVRCYEKLGNDSARVAALLEGISCHPEHDYFYLHLMDHYCDNMMYDEGVILSAFILNSMGKKAIYYQGISNIRMKQALWDLGIEAAQLAVQADSTFADAYFNLGTCYINKALTFAETACNDLTDPKCVQDHKNIQEQYRLALPQMEEYRRLRPDKKDRWAPALYRIYLYLNMGKKFAEIEEILNEKQ